MSIHTTTVTLPGDIRIELLISPDGFFRGIGAITVRGVPLRNAEVPLRIQMDTHDGILYTQLRLREIVPLADGGHELRLAALGLPWGRGEILDDYAQSVIYPTLSDAAVMDDLRIELRPLRHSLGGHEWSGFCYRLHFRSDTRQVHRALIHATWELGGVITGNTVLCPGQCNQPVWRGTKEAMFTSACLRALHMYGQLHGNSFQLGPRAGMCQAFDFQHGPHGVLLGFWPEFDGLSSLLESRSGEDVLHVLDEYRLPLANELVTPAKWILFTPGNLPEHEARDLWWDTAQAVHGGIRQRFGVSASRMLPEGPFHQGFGYETRIHNNKLQMGLRAGQWVDHPDVIDAYAEQVLPRLAELGFKRFKPEVVTESDVTVLGMQRKLDQGIHGDLHCASVCATQRLLPAEFWGGLPAWRRMYERGHSLGLQIGHWIGAHMSPRAPILDQHPSYRMIDALGFPAGGGYGFHTLNVANWNSGFADWAFDDLRRWKEEAGLDFLWVDSYSNLGMLQINYADHMRPQYAAFARFLARLQQIGIREFTFESMSALGCPSFGMSDLQGAHRAQRLDVAGQNDFGWWADEPDMICDMHICLHDIPRSAAESERLQFQAMASRGMLHYGRSSEWGGFVSRDLDLPDWWRRNLAIFNRAEPLMHGVRRLLPDRAGVVWHSDAGRCIWTFTDVDVPDATAATIQLLHGQPAVVANGSVRLPAGGVYALPNLVTRLPI
jgi:hypothetical protein